MLPLNTHRLLTEVAAQLDQLDTEVAQLVSDAMEATAATAKLNSMTPVKKPPVSVSKQEMQDRLKNGS